MNTNEGKMRGFRLIIQNERGEYYHPRIEIKSLVRQDVRVGGRDWEAYDAWHLEDNLIYTWQGETAKLSSEDGQPYAFRVEIEGSNPDKILEAARENKRVLSKLGKDNATMENATMEDVIKALLKAGYLDVEYDARLSRHIPAGRVPPVEYERWVDDYQAMGRPCVWVNVYARDEQEAKTETIKGLAEENHREDLQAFLAAGCPVRRINSYGWNYNPARGYTSLEQWGRWWRKEDA